MCETQPTIGSMVQNPHARLRIKLPDSNSQPMYIQTEPSYDGAAFHQNQQQQIQSPNCISPANPQIITPTTAIGVDSFQQIDTFSQRLLRKSYDLKQTKIKSACGNRPKTMQKVPNNYLAISESVKGMPENITRMRGRTGPLTMSENNFNFAGKQTTKFRNSQRPGTTSLSGSYRVDFKSKNVSHMRTIDNLNQSHLQDLKIDEAQPKQPQPKIQVKSRYLTKSPSPRIIPKTISPNIRDSQKTSFIDRSQNFRTSIQTKISTKEEKEDFKISKIKRIDPNKQRFLNYLATVNAAVDEQMRKSQQEKDNKINYHKKINERLLLNRYLPHKTENVSLKIKPSEFTTMRDKDIVKVTDAKKLTEIRFNDRYQTNHDSPSMKQFLSSPGAQRNQKSGRQFRIKTLRLTYYIDKEQRFTQLENQMIFPGVALKSPPSTVKKFQSLDQE